MGRQYNDLERKSFFTRIDLTQLRFNKTKTNDINVYRDCWVTI